MAVLKKIQFGSGSATPLAKTVVTAKSGGVMSVAAPTNVTNGVDEDADYQYELDVNVDGNTIVKSSGSLAIGTVPAANVSVADTGDNFEGTTVEAVLAELQSNIDSVDGAAKSYKIVEVANPASTSLAEYKIQEQVGEGSWGDVSGSSTIVVPKDNAFVTAQLGHVGATADSSTGVITDGSGADALLIEYINGSGVYTLVAVPIGSFLTESEFKDGLAVNANGEVSAKLGQGLEFGGESGENQSIKVKIDSTSSDAEGFLSVGANGVKISGVQDAIGTSIAALDVTTDAAVAGQYVAAIEETDGVVAVKTRANVSEAVLNNYAKGTAPAAGSEAVAATDTVNQAIAKLEYQVDAAKSATTTAIQNLDNTDTAVTGQVVTAVSTADGIASPTKADFAGITLGGFTQDATATGAIASTDTLGAALNKLENGIEAAASAASAAHSVVAQGSGNTHVTVTASQPDASTGAVTYTIGETNIADADDLSDEITRAQNAEGEIAGLVGLSGTEGSRTFTATTNYGGNSASVQANMQALDTQIKANADAIAGITYQISGTTLIFNGIPQASAGA